MTKKRFVTEYIMYMFSLISKLFEGRVVFGKEADTGVEDDCKLYHLFRAVPSIGAGRGWATASPRELDLRTY